MFIQALLLMRMRVTVLAFLVFFGGDLLAASPSGDTSAMVPPAEHKEVDESGALHNESASVSKHSGEGVTNSSGSLIASSGNRVAASPGVNSSDWLKAILGLASVVALIFAIAWFVKRFTGLAVSNQQQMRIISAIPVGAKERIALIEVVDKQLLVGITQHNINLLHSFEEPVVNKNDKTAVDFSSRLQAILSKSSSD